jgi:hypothetical protein
MNPSQSYLPSLQRNKKGVPLGLRDNIFAVEKSLGWTPAGRDWCIRALDPCAEIKTGGVRIPDYTVNKTVAMNFHTDFTVTAPAGVEANQGWDLYILELPLPEAPYIVYTKPSSTPAFDFSEGRVISMPAVNFSTLRAPNPPAGITPYQLLSDGPTMINNSTAFRTTFKGLSCIVDVPTLTDEGMLHAGQFRMAGGKTAVPIGNMTDGVVAEIGASCNRNLFTKLPTDVSGLQAVCPTFLRTRARAGYYIPTFFNNAQHTYVSAPSDPLHASDTGLNTYPIEHVVLEFVETNGNDGFRGPLTSGGQYVGVSGTDNTQVGVCIITGIAGSANLDFRGELGLEAQASPNSPWYPFMANAPFPDPKALQDQIIIQDMMAPAYLEKYNSLGLLVPVIGAAVSALTSFGMNAISGWLNKTSSRNTPVKGKYIEEGVD